MSTLLTRLGKEAIIRKRAHPHGLRHTCAFEMSMEGMPLVVIQRQLGHVWAASTANYLDHIAPKEVIDRVKGRVWRVPPDSTLASLRLEHLGPVEIDNILEPNG